MGSRRARPFRHAGGGRPGTAPGARHDDAFVVALAAHRRGDLDAAREGYTRILERQPQHFDALHLLGVIAVDLGQPDVAETLIGLALQVRPRAHEAMGNLALALKALGRIEEAEQALRNALRIAPDFVNGLRNLASILLAQGNHKEAATLLQRAVRSAPGIHSVRANLGALLLEDGQAEAAWPHLEKAVELAPDEPGYLANLGRAALDLDRIDEGAVACERALSLAPDHVPALVTLSAIERIRERLDLAELYATAALAVSPGDRGATVNLATALSDMIRIDDATHLYDRLLARDPCDVEARTSRGAVALARGLLDQAWPDYAWRWRLARSLVPNPPALPEWQGESLGDGTLYVWPEQGVGDEIVFASMLPELIERTPRVVIACDTRLVRVFERSFPRARIVTTAVLADLAQNLSEQDRQCSMGDLGTFLRPSLESFPQRRRYLVPNPVQAERWREWLNSMGEGIKVGFSWRSQNLHAERRLACTALSQWGPILGSAGVRFVSLQYDECEAELNDAEARFGVALHRPPELDQRNDLNGVIALMAGLDLVVTAPTTVSTLAGAVGTPTWQLTRGVDWHGMSRERSPWQPSVRQIHRRWNVPWDDVLADVADELRAYVEAGAAAKAA